MLKHNYIMAIEGGTEERGTIQVLKPKSIVNYNDDMLSVDIYIKMVASHPIMRRNINDYKKLFYISWMSLY